MSDAHGTVHWSELMTRDPVAARAFFEKTLGWRIEEWSMTGDGRPPYLVCMAGERPVAGIMDMNRPEFGDLPPHWMTYVAVGDADAAARRVREAGGEVLREPFDVPQVGRIVMIRDPSGAALGLIQPAEASGAA